MFSLGTLGAFLGVAGALDGCNLPPMLSVSSLCGGGFSGFSAGVTSRGLSV